MKPIRSINELFSVLAGTYASEWQRQLDAAPLGDVKSAWMHQLERFSGSMHCIDWALQNLPERCPNPVQFRNLCSSAPAAEVPRLPEPKADPERMKLELAKLAPMREPVANQHDCKRWAKELLENPKGCTPTAMQMARDALGQGVEA